ncbi:TonB-dependent receptor [Sphingorhabdus sp.]|uniref:TonB-dependent receptor n=1 Tax=Sphingorhabdus sp. TaxID=1902408 RepID=UPI0035B4E73C
MSASWKTNEVRARLAQTTSATALALAAFAVLPGAAYAQDAAAEDVADEEEAIVVTGFRAALESAVAEKKNAEQIVESVSAEDIGKLPDASIAESIARLPGLTSQRLNGRSAFISIRGFGPDLSQTLLNGREQTSTGDNRAVEFDQYPSEMVSQVNVYKTPSANIIGQGLVGTVDIRTARPLETGKRVLAFGVKGSLTDLGKLNAGSNDKGYRVNATYIDQFGGDTVGIALTANYVDESYQVQEYNAWGYNDFSGARLIAGNKSFVTSTNLKRFGLGGTLQGDLSDNVRITADLFYSKFDDDIIKRGIELPLSSAFGWTSAGINPGYTVQDGHIVNGTFTNIEAVVNNHKLVRSADLFSSGFNVDWDIGNGWNATFDWGTSRTDRNELVFESNAGTGRGQGVGARDTIGFTQSTTGTVFRPTLNYSDPNLIRLTSPMGWGGIAGGQDGYYNDRLVDDELTTVRFDLEKELDGFFSAVRAGVAYNDRGKSLYADEYFVVLASGAADLRVPDQYLLRPTNLNYLGLGPVISYDPQELLEGGIYRLVPNAVQDVISKNYVVDEELITGYLQAAIDTELGSSQLTGNVGVQVIKAEQSSTGALFFNGVATPTTLGTSYTDWLPSLNLSLRTASDFVIRVGLAREIQRPRMDQMRVSIGYGVDRSGPTPVIRGGGGNPFLEPIRANAADLTFEKYFGTKGYVAAQLFYKKLLNWIYNAEFPFDYTGFPLGAEVVPSRIGTLNAPLNGDGGKIYGVELAGTLPFETFTPSLEGFGLTGGVSYTKSKLRPAPGQPYGDIDGYSRWVANGTAYFEKNGFSARGSVRYRSTFQGELSGFGGNRVRRRARGEMIVDAQLGYDFRPGSSLEGLSLFIQGQNLTNEAFSTINPGAPLEVIDYQTYGRRYQAGITFKF